MESRLDFSGKLDFSEIDLTAPNIVVEEIVSEISKATNDIIQGKVIAYSGPIFTYTKKGIDFSTLLSTDEREVDIQDSLGKQGEKEYKFEVFLNTPIYESYKYRVCFIQYGISNYPATVVLDKNVAHSISLGQSSKYIYRCSDRKELEDLMIKVIYCKQIISAMQELIRVYQAKKSSISEESNSGNENIEK